jgi:hypothetical protein
MTPTNDNDNAQLRRYEGVVETTERVRLRLTLS